MNHPTQLDSFGRRITSLRISVTDKCNFRCTYCMPEEGITLKLHDDLLRYEEIVAIVREAAAMGIHKIKLTGGEPLLRKNLIFLIREIAAIDGITDLGMTTNGSLLTPAMARMLKEAGLMRVNISLDSLDPATFAEITRGAELVSVLQGIDAAIEAGFSKVKINMVIMENTPESAIKEMRSFCVAKGIELQTIAHFTLDRRNVHRTLATDRPPPCSQCNRLRLTADGFLKPCLFSDDEVRVDLNNIRASLLKAVSLKPETGNSCNNRLMPQIGG